MNITPLARELLIDDVVGTVEIHKSNYHGPPHE
jgi:hypothetical protein